MAIDINKIVENALAESDKKETLTESKEIKDLETESETTFTEEDEEIINMFNELFGIAESTAFASGLGALTFRAQLKSLSEANGVKKPMSLKKKVGIGIGSGLAAAGAGYAAYKHKGELGDMAQKAGSAIKSTTKNVVKNIKSKFGDNTSDNQGLLRNKEAGSGVRKMIKKYAKKINGGVGTSRMVNGKFQF